MSKLWYKSPAKVFEEALPIGNGRMGAMVYSGITNDLLHLNEDTLWAGYPIDKNNPKAKEVLGEVRNLLFANEFEKAHILIHENMLSPWTDSYQPFGDLNVVINDICEDDATDYLRELTLQDGTVRSRFSVNGVNYSKSSWISYPAQLVFYKVSVDKKSALNCSIFLSSQLDHCVKSRDNTLVLEGRAPACTRPNYDASAGDSVIYDEAEENKSIRFCGGARVITDGMVTYLDDKIIVTGATDIEIRISLATSFLGFDKMPSQDEEFVYNRCIFYFSSCADKNHDWLYDAHKQDFANLYNRTKFCIGEGENSNLPTDERLKMFDGNASNDIALYSLLFEYGRYLLISSSREGSQPANLQGVWNKDVRPPWSSNYTTNINAQMNYWLAECANLSECHEPMLKMLGEVAKTGAITAKTNYDAKGWTIHHNVDLWRTSAAMGAYADGYHAVTFGMWPMGGGWMSRQLMEHYQYSNDIAFLKDYAYPIMHGAAEFLLDWLVEDEQGKYLVTNPSTTPENTFIYADKVYSASVGSTCDMAIITDCFENILKAAKELGIDENDEFILKIKVALKRLRPYKIGSLGQLVEWRSEYTEKEVNHRHVSHLYGLHPGYSITPEKTPELAQACRESLRRRGDEGTGWSLAWKVNMWARLNDGDHALKILKRQLKLVETDGFNMVNGGGTYPNMLDAHPPFQIDGNFGVVAGMCEMIMQSHSGCIKVLPALPSDWKSGSVCGLVAKGGFVVDISWNDGKLIDLKITAKTQGATKIFYSSKMINISINKGETKTLTASDF